MNRRLRRQLTLSRPWWTFTESTPDGERVSLVGYGARQARTARRTRHVGARRAGRGLLGYPRFGP